MHNRRAITLVEMVTATIVGAAIFGVAVGLLYTLLRFDTATRQQVRLQIATERLADQFRRDAHAAERLAPLAAASGAAPPGWQFQLGEGVVAEYRLRPGRLLRVELASGKTVRQEQFAFSEKARLTVEPAEAAAGIVSLTIAPPNERPKTPGFGPLVIEAALGKDRRFVKAEGH